MQKVWPWKWSLSWNWHNSTANILIYIGDFFFKTEAGQKHRNEYAKSNTHKLARARHRSVELQFLYTVDLLQLISCHLLHPHTFANEPQIYGFCKPYTTNILCQSLSACINDASRWLKSKRLLLNPAKTEILWCSSPRHPNLIPTPPLSIGNTSILPVSAVRDLGVYVNAHVTMKSHVTVTVRSCFAALRQICSVSWSLPRHALLTLIRILVVSKVYYCISVLAGITGRLMDKL